ncbi:efflux RND transporter periplasmic adaptor subunit [Kibdelosporangium aridum]|uniref:Putative peptidoglycan binding domain-containing protein n=1 Tax=Kibdelosporangium aridum TaxID=2030 RepID=A0A1W2FR54_KIBAR|nr:peptidoglycan-binding protein [Kibdelosporangium aridum]SMD24202.1 Putative peptidoglycan binding domain-containing protein [Kibdelosporangium aridum]
MSRKGILITAGVLLVAVAGAIVVALVGGKQHAATASGPEPARTTTVVKTDLSLSEEFTGTLGFGDETPLKARAAGTVTWLPAAGAKIGRGDVLYKVDNRPAVLFIGGTPTYRKLDAPGIKGPDVKVVNQNLADLGYLSKSAGRSDTFTEASQAAVKKWQKALKTDETGIVDLPDVVVLPAPVRIGTVNAQLGTTADGPLVGYTSDVKVVTMSVDSAIATGTKVDIVLPSGSKTTGSVAAVAKSQDKPDTNPVGGGTKMTATVTVDDPSAVAAVEGSVTVKVVGSAKSGVLAVPIGALLAVKEGGYALQVVTGNTTKLVPVETGMFANGMVEVSGTGITEGLTVVTAS